MAKSPKSTGTKSKSQSLTQIIKQYKNCKDCICHETARSHVFYRGAQSPIDLLFIGEAPGNIEDLYGEPFVGPSGDLLDSLIGDALETIFVGIDLSYGFTNLVCCRPLDQEGNIRRPTMEEVWACSDRLSKMIRALKPTAIILLGRSAASLRKILGTLEQYLVLELQHPSYILRKGGLDSFEYAENLLFLEEFLEENFDAEKMDLYKLHK